MSQAVDRKKARGIEVRFRAGSYTLDGAERLGRSACDYLMIVQGYREEGATDALVTASIDSATQKPLSLDSLYNAWIALAGQIAVSPEETHEALKIKRFVKLVLARLDLDERLQRVTEPRPAT